MPTNIHFGQGEDPVLVSEDFDAVSHPLMSHQGATLTRRSNDARVLVVTSSVTYAEEIAEGAGAFGRLAARV